MKILLIEDEQEFRKAVTDYLKSNDYECTSVDTLKKGLEKSLNYTYDCVLVDVGLPDGSGIDIINSIKKNNPGRHCMLHCRRGNRIRPKL